MTLGDAIQLGLELEARCRSAACGARTPLSTVFFLNRFGATATLETVSHRIHCMACGAEHPVVTTHQRDEDTVTQTLQVSS